VASDAGEGTFHWLCWQRLVGDQGGIEGLSVYRVWGVDVGRALLVRMDIVG
jgi:hypothetical protein